jgi:hypothetical protein
MHRCYVRAVAALLAILGLCAAAATLAGQPTRVNQGTRWTYGNPALVTIEGYSGPQEDPVVSPDGQYLFFDSHNDARLPSYLYYAKYIDYRRFRFIGKIPGVQFQGIETTEDAAHNIYFVSPVFLKQAGIAIGHGKFSGGSVTDIAPVRYSVGDSGGTVGFPCVPGSPKLVSAPHP